MNKTTSTFLPNYSICDPILVDTLENNIDKDDIYYSLCEIMSKVDISSMFKDGVLTEAEGRGRKPYDPKKLLFAILLAYAENNRSTRDISNFIKYDLRTHFLFHKKSPSHTTINNFMHRYLVKNIDDIFDQIILALQELDEEHLDNETVYIDGTKIEAVSNKYTFVWKKASEKFRSKMQDKVTKELVELNELYFSKYQLKIEPKDLYEPTDLMDIINLIRYVMEQDHIQIIETGKGKRTPKLQKYLNKITDYLDRTMKYIKDIEICGETRNSYSKTDLEATFLRMKTDYMGNTALLPAYNLQLLTSGRYIVLAECYQYGSDTSCFMPIMEKFNQRYHHYPNKIVGDAGYGVLRNYEYCDVNDIEAYLKYPRFQRDCHPTKKQDYYNKFMISNFEKENGEYFCPWGKAVKFFKYKQIEGLDADRVTELYKCDECIGCPFRGKCSKNVDAEFKIFELNTAKEEHYQKAREMLQSEEGHKLRANRAAIAEGAFGDIKANYKFNRFTRTSLINVNFEAKLVALGHNIRAYRNIKREKLSKN